MNTELQNQKIDEVKLENLTVYAMPLLKFRRAKQDTICKEGVPNLDIHNFNMKSTRTLYYKFW